MNEAPEVLGLIYTGRAPVRVPSGRVLYALDGIEFDSSIPLLVHHSVGDVAGEISRIALISAGLVGTLDFRHSAAGHLALTLASHGAGLSGTFEYFKEDVIQVNEDERLFATGRWHMGPFKFVARSRLLEASVTDTPRDSRTHCFVLLAKDPTQPTMPRAEQLAAVLA
jgi:hypothetical protein